MVRHTPLAGLSMPTAASKAAVAFRGVRNRTVEADPSGAPFEFGAVRAAVWSQVPVRAETGDELLDLSGVTHVPAEPTWEGGEAVVVGVDKRGGSGRPAVVFAGELRFRDEEHVRGVEEMCEVGRGESEAKGVTRV